MWQIAWGIIAVWLLTANVVTAVLFLIDKRAAAKGNRRIAEATLLISSALGGWPAAILVARAIRHKTAKRSFRLKFVFASLVSIGTFAAVGLLMLRT